MPCQPSNGYGDVEATAVSKKPESNNVTCTFSQSKALIRPPASASMHGNLTGCQGNLVDQWLMIEW